MRAAGAAGDRAAWSTSTQLEGGWSRHTYALAVADPERAEPRSTSPASRPPGSVLDTDLGQEFALYRC